MKNFLLVSHGGKSRKFSLEDIRKNNLNLYLACEDIPYWLKNLVDEKNIIQISKSSGPDSINIILNFLKNRNIALNGIGTFTEKYVIQTADLACSLNLKGLPPQAARNSSNNKVLMKKLLIQGNIPTARYQIITDLDYCSLKKAIAVIGTPCVIKPNFGSSSYNVLKILSTDRKELDSIINTINLNFSNKYSPIPNEILNTYLVEEFIDGKVVSVDGIVQNKKILILGMVEFSIGKEPWFMQEEYIIPANITEQEKNQCFAVTQKIINYFNFDNCGFHCELKLSHEGPKVLEIAGRLPGGQILRGYEVAYDLNIVNMMLDVWLGNEISFQPIKLSKYVLQKPIFAHRSGIIQKFNNIELLQTNEAVWDFDKMRDFGDEVKSYPYHPDTIYYYAISANRYDELRNIVEYLDSHISCEIRAK